MKIINFVTGFIIGTLFGWKIVNWILPKIIDWIGGII